MKQLFLLLCVPGVLLTQGCKQPAQTTPAKSDSSIVTEITPGLKILHEVQSGQTLEWRTSENGPTDFWIFFGTETPCQNGQKTLHGSSGHPASCVAGSKTSGHETLRYAYDVYSEPPPRGGYPDRVVRCDGCSS